MEQSLSGQLARAERHQSARLLKARVVGLIAVVEDSKETVAHIARQQVQMPYGKKRRRAAARRRNLSRSPRSAMLPAVPPQPLHRNRRARRGAPRSQPPAAG